MIGFNRNPREASRRAVYSPGTGQKLGYFCLDKEGKQVAQDVKGNTVMRIIRWKDRSGFYTDSNPCSGSFVPSGGYYE